MCYINSYLLVSIEAWNLTCCRGMSFLEWCCWKKRGGCSFFFFFFFFALSSCMLLWSCPLVIISRTILVDAGSNDIMCHLLPNSRNQWQARYVIASIRFSCEIALVTNVCLEMVWPMNRSTTFSCCRCCYRVWILGCYNVRVGFVLIWGWWICSSFNVSWFLIVN